MIRLLGITGYSSSLLASYVKFNVNYNAYRLIATTMNIIEQRMYILTVDC